VFGFCADRFEACPIYLKLTANEPKHEQSEELVLLAAS
jgi:hypothetical protein